MHTDKVCFTFTQNGRLQFSRPTLEFRPVRSQLKDLE